MRGHLAGILVELVERKAEIHAEPDEPLLRAVVQVALEPAALVDSRVDRPGARLLQLLDPRVLGRLAEQGAHENAVEQREGADDPRRGEGEQQAGERGERPAARPNADTCRSRARGPP